MDAALIIIWIVSITSVAFAGSWYARRYNAPDLLIGLYVAFVLCAQILAVKISTFDLGFIEFVGPSGVLLFSVTYLLTDIVNEKFGRGATHKMIFIAFVSQVAMVGFFWIGVQMPPASFWTMDTAWREIFGIVPRITLAGWIAFFVSENFDAYVYARLKQITQGKHLWARNALSSIPALFIDSLIFIPLAFFGTMPLWPLIVGQTALKWMVGLINIPFMYMNRAILSKNQ